jgi:hypothetical protein
VLLTDHLAELRRTQPVGERPVGPCSGGTGEQIGLIASPDDLANALAVAHNLEAPEAGALGEHLQDIDIGDFDTVDDGNQVAGPKAISPCKRLAGTSVITTPRSEDGSRADRRYAG